MLDSRGASPTRDRSTIRHILGEAGRLLAQQGVESPSLDTHVLLAEVLGRPRSWLIAHEEDTLGAHDVRAFHALVQRRAAREPVAYILGRKEFYGLSFLVSPDVLIPRPETELLVEVALRRVTSGSFVVDVGTGSGCIGISIAANSPGISVLAIDKSISALEVARANASRHGVESGIRFVNGDLLQPVLDQGLLVDMVVSNPPYIPSVEIGELRPEVSGYEPLAALDGGTDGLEVIQRLMSQAVRCLSPDGEILVEMGHEQHPEAAGIASGCGLRVVEVHYDLSGIARVLQCRR